MSLAYDELRTLAEECEGEFVNLVTPAALLALLDEAQANGDTAQQWRVAYNDQVIRNAALDLEAARLRAALGEIEAHHVEQNRLKGRAEDRSQTLRIARRALEEARDAER